MTERYIPYVGEGFRATPITGGGEESRAEWLNARNFVCKNRGEYWLTTVEGHYFTIDSYIFTPSNWHTSTTVEPKGDVEATLVERGRTYGPYKFQATISQGLKDVMRKTPGFGRMSPYQQESLDMIANKLGRILNGDPNYVDSWLDIAGYAQLVVDQLNGKST